MNQKPEVLIPNSLARSSLTLRHSSSETRVATMSTELAPNISTATTTSRSKKAPSTRRSTSLIKDVVDDARFRSVAWCFFLVMTGSMVGQYVLFSSWAIGTFPFITRWIETLGARGVFAKTPFVDAKGLPSLLRYADYPAMRFLHIFPAGLWSLIAPLQLSERFRSKNRTAHRYLGRFFVAMSMSIGIGLIPLVQMDKDRPHVNGAMVLLSAAYFLSTALLAINHARNKRFSEHRVWMLRHVAIGYSVHLKRVLWYATWWVSPLVVPGYSDHTLEGYEKRTFIFGVYLFASALICVVAMEIWVRHTLPAGRISSKGSDIKTG